MKTFNNLKEMEPFYDEKINAYVFKENDLPVDVNISFNLCIHSGIVAGNINADDIKAKDINAWNIKADDINTGNINAWNIKTLDINAGNINADDINYYATCIARQTFKCKTVKGRRKNSLHACLDSDIVFKKEG